MKLILECTSQAGTHCFASDCTGNFSEALFQWGSTVTIAQYHF